MINLGYSCKDCNLQIQNRDKSIPMFFHNGSKYDSSIILEGMSNTFKDQLTLNCIGTSVESFKMLNFKFKGLKYSLKILDSRNFLKGALSDLSEHLPGEYKIITKQHFSEHFELFKIKISFFCNIPCEYITKENIYEENLPNIKNFYGKIKLDSITEEEYLQTLEIYKKLNCVNIKQFLEIYLKLDICLLSDCIKAFRYEIWNEFEIDMTKYITSCSLSKDLLLKYTNCKIKLFKDILMYDFTDKSTMGGLCVVSQNIVDNDDNLKFYQSYITFTI